MPKRKRKNSFNNRPLKKRKMDNPTSNFAMDEVLPNLYIGPMWARLHIRKFEIKHVVSLVSKPCDKYPISKKVNEHYYSIEDSDNTVLQPTLKNCLPKIHSARQANENVLVHCRAGVSRSASVVIAYLMLYENMDFDTAMEHLRKVRPCISPNYGFMRQLRSLNNSDETIIEEIKTNLVLSNEYYG